MPDFSPVFRRAFFAASLATLPLIAIPAGSASAHGDDAPKVVTSIKPIHSIASAIMKDIGEPALLVDGASSPHAYSLRPSEARALSEADLVVYVSHSLEGFLQKPLQTLSKSSHQLELVAVEGMALRKMRDGGAWEAHQHGDHDEDHAGHDDDHHDHDEHDDHAHGDHDDHNEHAHDDHDDHDKDHHHDDAKEADDHDHDHAADTHDSDDDHHHEHGGIDPHIWMDPANGASIAIAITDELVEIDPEHADAYRDNLKTLLASLTSLGNDLRQKVAPIQGKPYVVFHDAYQYLEAGFGLTAVGSITVSPDQKPGAKRLHEIEDKIRDTGAVCIFAEPQFRPAVVQAVVSDTGIRTGTLDPLGADLKAGPDTYQQILAQNVDALVDCLGQGS
ncbi:zinc ABC transporter substrate-binding protein [uncultured Thalassospira sp.]|uniref:zinc ABC transporter substrate-binding protein n=1 Tax=uncultured Thalassospira sp. TaxID=404382 RepID=UPI002585C834|nr:zinc ABC transporter substrate-binding protein [uncultured Thalassospira sp.]